MAAKDQLELARWACELATREGAAEARSSVSRQHRSRLQYRERRLETLEESTTKSLGLALYINGKYSSHRTSDVRKEALPGFVREAVAMTRYLTEDEHRRLPEPEYYTGRSDVDLDLMDDAYDRSEPNDRHQVARAIEAATLDAGGDALISATSTYSESKSETAMVATNGFEGFEHRTDFWCTAEATARDAGDKRPEDWWYEGYHHRGALPDPAAIGRHAAERTLSRIGADKIPTEELPFLIENRSVDRLMEWFHRAMTGRALQQKRSFLDGKRGEKIASEHLTLIDDPLLVRGQASRLYDGEGIAARRLPIIRRGVLENYYIDTYYGRKLGMPATTGSASNVTFESDVVKSPAAWMRELERGIMITGFLGGNSNSSTGDFSVGLQGYLFENGERRQPVAQMNLAGNHLTFWNKLIGIGDDPNPFSSWRSPTLVFEKHVIAGA